MPSLPLSIRFVHLGRLSAGVKYGLLCLALISGCAIFASIPAYLRAVPVDFRAPTYPAPADVSACLAASSS